MLIKAKDEKFLLTPVFLMILNHLMTIIVLITIEVITILQPPNILVRTLRTLQTILMMDPLVMTVLTILKTPTRTVTLQPRPYAKKSWAYSEESLQKVQSKPATPIPSRVLTPISSLPSLPLALQPFGQNPRLTEKVVSKLTMLLVFSVVLHSTFSNLTYGPLRTPKLKNPNSFILGPYSRKCLPEILDLLTRSRMLKTHFGN